MLFLLEKNARLVVGFMIIGITLCLYISGVNGMFLSLFGGDLFFVTTTITPITEEIIKALPIVFFAFVFSDRRETLVAISLAVGIGFAILENSFILIKDINQATLFWALIRGFGSGLMHGLCTAAVGFGMSFVKKRKKLCYTGTFALLSAAIIYHATYNCLVQSEYKYIGFLLPAVTYLPFIILITKRKKQKAITSL